MFEQVKEFQNFFLNLMLLRQEKEKKKEKEEKRITKFFFKIKDKKKKKRASVPLLQPIAYLVLQNFEKFFSKIFTLVPLINSLFFITLTISLILSLKIFLSCLKMSKNFIIKSIILYNSNVY